MVATALASHRRRGVVLARIDPKELEAAFAAHAQWVQSAGARGERLFLMNADLSGIDWSGKDLTEAVLGGAQLVGAKLRGTKLYGALLSSAILDGGDLSGAQLAKSEFDYISALGTNFRACNALRATFMEADLRGASFENSNLTKVMFNQANLEDTDLRATNLDRVSFDGARVAGVRLSGAIGLEKAFAKSVDIGRAGQSEVLHGEAALDWLRRATMR